MRKLLSILVLMMFAVSVQAQYNAPADGIPINKAMAPAQATPMDARTMIYDGVNFLYRAYKDTIEVISNLNLQKNRVGNAVYIVDSGGTLNSNGTFTNFHATYWTFQDGVADVNLIKLNWNGSGGCPSCFSTSTQLSDTSFKLNRPNLTSDTFDFRFGSVINIVSANNFLTLTGTNVQAGGPLTQNTYANGGGHIFGITGNSFQEGMGAAIASANVITTGTDGNAFSVIGSTAINDITTTNWQAGSIISFIFTGTPTLSNNVVGPAGSAPMLLAGSVNYTAATNDNITFLYDGSFWHEISRKIAGAGGVYTFSNGLTEFPATQVKLGGTLLNPTTIAGNGNPLYISGGRFEPGMGLPILAANNLVPGNDGILFHVTGTTQINAINTQNFQAGAEIGFIFDGIVTVKNNTVGGINTAPMLLAGRVDYTSAVGDYMGFKYDGVNWYETERKLAGTVSSGVTTANNGLNLSTSTNVQLGGTLITPTTIDAGSNSFLITGTSNPTLHITNTGSGEAILANGASGQSAIRAFATGGSFVIYGQTDNGAGVTGVATATGGIGVFGQSTGTGGNSIGVFGLAAGSGSFAAEFTNGDATTNTIITNTEFTRSSSGTTSAGVGQSLDFLIQTSTGALDVANQVISKWTDATNATRTSQYSITGVNSSATSTLWTLDGNGNVTTTAGKINHIITTAAGTYGILSTDWTVVGVGATSTWNFPTLVTGQVWNLVNHGSGSITLGTAVTTANGTTSTTITAGTTYQVQYDGTLLRKIN